MTTDVAAEIEEATTEEFGDPRPPGMGPFGKIGSTLLFVTLIMTGVLIKLAAWWLGLAFGLVAFPLLAATTIRDPITGVTRASVWNRKRLWKQGERRGTNQYVCGPVSRIGKLLLPGFLAQSSLTEAHAGDMTPFGLVEIPSTNDFGIGIRCRPDGASLLSPATLLQFANRWGSALKFFCNEPSAIQVAVTICTAPDPGDSERDRIMGSILPGASDYSRQVLTELADMTPPGAAIVDSYVTVSFDGDHAGKPRTATQMSVDLAPRLPEFVAKLITAGAGHCTLMDAQDITDAVQSAYDPHSAQHISRMRTAGMRTGAGWDQIGPPRADNQWRQYQHASGVSVTWTMVDIEGAVNITTLEPLIRADNHCDVKRMTILYRLRDPSEKNRLAQKDRRHAAFHTTNKPNHDARDQKRVTSTDKTARDVARSAGLVDISVILTATVMDRVTTTVDEDGQEVREVATALSRVPAMVAAIEQAAPQSMLGIIRQDGGHAATFTAGLGMGVPLVPYRHSKLSVALQEDL